MYLWEILGKEKSRQIQKEVKDKYYAKKKKHNTIYKNKTKDNPGVNFILHKTNKDNVD